MCSWADDGANAKELGLLACSGSLKKRAVDAGLQLRLLADLMSDPRASKSEHAIYASMRNRFSTGCS